nr:LysR family transcriptional regulator [Pseudoxanthomonas sp. J35]
MSITEAARELCLTQSAVSRQVQALEAQVGVRLFRRGHRSRSPPRASACSAAPTPPCSSCRTPWARCAIASAPARSPSAPRSASPACGCCRG